MAVAALVLGILSIVISGIPVAGWILGLAMGVVAIVLGALGRTRQPDKKGMAVAGMILGIIGVALSVIWVIACGALAATGMGVLEEAGIDLEDIADQIKDSAE